MADIYGGGFLSGYLDSQNRREQGDLRKLQQVSGVLGLQKQIQEQEQGVLLKNIMAQSNGDIEQAIPALIKAGQPQLAAQLNPLRKPVLSPTENMREFALSQTNPEFQAYLQSRDAAKRPPARPVAMGPNGVLMPDNTVISPAPKPEEKPKPTNTMLEFNLYKSDPAFRSYQERMAGFRRPPAASPTALPKPPKDYRWNADGSEMVVIPGSQTDTKMKAAKTKDQRNKVLLDSTIDAEINNINKLIGSPDGKVKEHPGLKAMVGSIDARMPTFFSDTANAEALLESLQSKASISSLQTIRGTSGAIGTLTEKEWPRLENMKATLQMKQDESQFRQSLKDYREELLRIKRIAADSEWSDL